MTHHCPATRSFLGLFVKPLFALALTSVTLTASAAGPAKIKLGAAAWVGFAPFYVADAKDFFKKYNVKVSIQTFSDPALIPSALVSEAIDGEMVTYDQVIAQVAAGKRHKVVMPIDYSFGGDAIVAGQSIKKLSDLKGKKVGYNPLTPSDFLLSYALKTAGLSEKDISPVNLMPEAVPAAMASGQLTVGVTYEPSLSQILSQGGGKKYQVLFSSKNAPGLIADVLVFDEKFIKARPNDVKAVIQGYLDGLAFLKAKPDEAAQIIGKVLGVPPKEVLEQLKGVYAIPLAEMPKAFVKSKETTSYFTSGAIIGELLKAKGQINSLPPTESTFDGSFVNGLAGSK